MTVILQTESSGITQNRDAAIAIPAEQISRLSQMTTAWLASKRSKHTQANYRRDLRDWLAWCDHCGINPLTAKIMHTDAWIAYQRQHGVRLNPQGASAPAAESSIARRIATVSSWYRYLINNSAGDDHPLITYNPANTDSRPRVDPDYSPTIGLEPNEADRLLAAADADGCTSAALIRLLLLDGLRCGSAVSARIEGLGHDHGHRTLTVAVKGGKTQVVAVPPVLDVAINAMLTERGSPAEGPLFVTSRGTPAYESWVFRMIRRLAAIAGISTADKLSPHSLRHAAITELLDSGASLRDAQDFAGHNDPRTTRRYDRRRNNLDRHGSYVLAGRFGQKE